MYLHTKFQQNRKPRLSYRHFTIITIVMATVRHLGFDRKWILTILWSLGHTLYLSCTKYGAHFSICDRHNAREAKFKTVATDSIFLLPVAVLISTQPPGPSVHLHTQFHPIGQPAAELLSFHHFGLDGSGLYPFGGYHGHVMHQPTKFQHSQAMHVIAIHPFGFAFSQGIRRSFSGLYGRNFVKIWEKRPKFA